MTNKWREPLTKEEQAVEWGFLYAYTVKENPKYVQVGARGRVEGGGSYGEGGPLRWRTRSGCRAGILAATVVLVTILVDLSLLGGRLTPPGLEGRRRRGGHVGLAGALRASLSIWQPQKPETDGRVVRQR